MAPRVDGSLFCRPVPRRWLRRAQQVHCIPRVGRSALVVAWDRAELRRNAVGQIEEGLVDIAPAPAFGRVVTFDNRMSRRAEMFGGVAVRRVVAAADMTAGAT